MPLLAAEILSGQNVAEFIDVPGGQFVPLFAGVSTTGSPITPPELVAGTQVPGSLMAPVTGSKNGSCGAHGGLRLPVNGITGLQLGISIGFTQLGATGSVVPVTAEAFAGS